MSDDFRRVREALADPAEVARLLNLRGVRRQRNGVLACCPVPSHKDSTPSLSLRVGADGTLAVKCFAGDLSGNVLHLIAAVEGLDVRRDARRVYLRACELAGIDSRTPLDGSTRREEAPRAPAPPRRVAQDDAAWARGAEVALVEGRLHQPHAVEVCAYLEQRGVLEQARADGWAAMPPAMLRTREWPQHPLCIPWRGPGGELVTLQRRRIDAGKDRYVLPAGRPATFPYGVEKLAAAPPGVPVALCEGAVDVLALRVLAARKGRPCVVLGLPGVEGWRSEWVGLLNGRRVLLATDADDAGDRASERIGAELVAAGISARRTRPATKDWCDAIRKG